MLTYEPARPEDGELLAAIMGRAFDADIHYGSPRVQGPPGYKSPDEHRKWMASHIYRKVLLDGRVIGAYIVGQVGGGRYQMDGIYLEPDCQNRGLGARIMQELEAAFPDAEIWTLETPAWNTRTPRFYEKLGYTKVKETPYFFHYAKVKQCS